MAQLTCENLVLGYEGKKIVKNLSFTINKGDYLCILGENGAGKTTLIKTLVHLTEPMEGEIFPGDGLKKNEIGYLPQQSEMQKDFPATVFEIVLSGCLSSTGIFPFYKRSHKQDAVQNMKRLGIDSLAKKSYRELSGGQQQRVLLARALCSAKKVLILDEPVSGLDPAATMDMYNLIEKLNKKDSVTVIMISHDVASAIKYASHILHIQSEQSFFGTKEEYINSNYGNFILSEKNKEV